MVSLHSDRDPKKGKSSVKESKSHSIGWVTIRGHQTRLQILGWLINPWKLGDKLEDILVQIVKSVQSKFRAYRKLLLNW